MDKKRFIIPFLLIIPFVLFSSGARDKISRANEMYLAGDYNKALTLYEEAEVDNPESPYIYLNKGITYFRLEDYEKAKQAFLSAASKSQDLKLEAKAYYNLGNTNFLEAARHTETDLKKAIELYQEAVLNYQVAMECDKNIPGAAQNIEATRLIVRDLLDKLKKQQEQNAEQDEKIKEIAEKLAKLIEKEQRQIDFTKNLKEEKDVKGVSGNLKNNIIKVKTEQQNIRKETSDVSTELAALMPQGAQVQGAERIQAAKEHVDVSVNFQELAGNQLTRTALAEALESETGAKEELVKALEALLNQQPGQDEPQQEQGEQEKQKEEEMKQQAGDADDILDEEREQRKARQIQGRSGYQEVERDW
ncbi:MAG: tetratricopeptide repeat protein [Spirochaetales bacterium]|nr:tetratricopeptide repeat protein [Spirochaetales bacterium]